MKASFLTVQVKCVPKKDSLHLFPRCRKRKHSLLFAQVPASRGQPNKPWSEVLLMTTFVLWRVRNTRAKWKPSDLGEKMIQTVQLGHPAGSLWHLSIWSLRLLKFYLKRWQMMTERFPAGLVTCLRHITWLASLCLGGYFSFPFAMIAIIPWRNLLKGKGLYSAHSFSTPRQGGQTSGSWEPITSIVGKREPWKQTWSLVPLLYWFKSIFQLRNSATHSCHTVPPYLTASK